MRRFAAIYLFCLLYFQAIGQQQLYFDQFDFRQGLSNQNVNCIFQDHLGFIWVGTEFGLNRFDGISFTSWYSDPSRLNSLIHNKVISLAEDKDHKLWVGTQEGLSCFDPAANKFLNYSTDGKGNFQFRKKNCFVYVDSNNIVWIGHDQGITILNVERTAFQDFPIQLRPTNKPTNAYVNSFNEDRSFVWAATSFGIYRFDKKTKQIKHYYLPPREVNPSALTSSLLDSKGRLWCGSWSNGITFLNPVTDSIHKIHLVLPGSDGMIKVVGQISEKIENNESWLYIVLSEGLLKIRADELAQNDLSSLQLHSVVQNQAYPINRMNLSDVYTDRAGNVWVGTTNNGLNKINLQQAGFEVYRFGDLVKDEFPPFRIFKINEHDHLIFTRRNLLTFHWEDKKFDVHPQPKAGIALYDMAEAEDHYWTTTDNGLLQLNKKMQLIKTHGETNSGLTTNRLRRVFNAGKGKLWISTVRQGIAIFDITQKKFTQKFYNPGEPVDLTGVTIPAIAMDNENNMWIGTGSGLYVGNESGKELKKIQLCKTDSGTADCESVQELFLSRDKKMYVGTHLGLYYFDFNDRNIHRVMLRGQGLSENIFGISEDEKGKLWLVTNNGLISYDPDAGKASLYSLKNGLPHNEITDLHPWNKMFLTGIPGAVVTFDPLAIQKRSPVPEPVFSSIHISDNVFARYFDPSPTISHDESISFNFISLNYVNTSQNQYSYMLGGLDNEWKYLGNTHTLRFSDLPAGKYRLLVKAADSDGNWNETPSEFSFSVTPPFWETWWFIALTVLSIGVVVYLFYKYRLNQALKLERLRTRIAMDLHDDVGATLSSISMYSEAIKKQVKEKLPHLEPILEKMEDNSRETISSMSDMVWSINPRNDSADKLSDRIESYAKDMCAVKDVQLHFSSDRNLNKVVLGPEQRKNIYLIFKEALNNSLKYSVAENIFVDVHVINNALRLIIKDDGKGFVILADVPGNGLKNMRIRSEEIHGELKISPTYEGTTVSLVCKIT